jgi:multicomponent Na+:H+ antiporter subunit A
VAAAALVLRYVAEGADDCHSVVPFTPAQLLGAGLLVAGLASSVGLITGAGFFADTSLDIHGIPLIGDLHVTSVLMFDIGVFLIVVGVVFAILTSLGAEMDGR